MEIRVAGVVSESIVDGPGIRFTLFVQGCPHNCEGCHNPETHDFEGGRIADTDKIYNKITENPLLQGVTFSGGEPFSQPEPLYDLAKKLKQTGMHLMSYSGYTFEQLVKLGEENHFVTDLLGCLDLLVDGRFVLAQRSLELKFRGSKNQRIIDVQRSIEEGKAVEAEI